MAIFGKPDKGKEKAVDTSQISTVPANPSTPSGNPGDPDKNKKKNDKLISDSTTSGISASIGAAFSKAGGKKTAVIGTLVKVAHKSIEVINDHPEEAKQFGKDVAIGMSKGYHGSKDNLHDLGLHSASQLEQLNKPMPPKMTSPLENTENGNSFNEIVIDDHYFNGYADLYNGLINQMLILNCLILLCISFTLLDYYIIKNSLQILQ
jgi:hypothetical protein